MAQRKQIEKAQRMNEPFILQISRDLFFEWLEIGEYVAVRDGHAPRLGCGP